MAQEAVDAVHAFSLGRSPLYPSIYVLSLGRGLFSSVTFEEEFHSFVTLLVLFRRKQTAVEWEAVIERTAKRIVLLIKRLESHTTQAELH